MRAPGALDYCLLGWVGLGSDGWSARLTARLISLLLAQSRLVTYLCLKSVNTAAITEGRFSFLWGWKVARMTLSGKGPLASVVLYLTTQGSVPAWLWSICFLANRIPVVCHMDQGQNGVGWQWSE